VPPADWSAFPLRCSSVGPLPWRVHADMCVCMEMERSCSFPGLGLKAVSVSPSWTAEFFMLLAGPRDPCTKLQKKDNLFS
jgi:hypothetical protein